MLEDLSPMPFGKHKGQPMQDVPVHYLHWFWHNGSISVGDSGDVHDYIKRNIHALKKENADLLWTR